jgi:L-glutamine-phosphate cytidylyltransferase
MVLRTPAAGSIRRGHARARRGVRSGIDSVNAIILSAGRGSRLLPLTEKRPKCLLPVAGRSVLDWQVQRLAEAGIERCTVVVGFGADLVKSALATMRIRPERLQTLYNPLYSVADNLVSCWVARDEMDSDFVLLNGDTLFEPELMTRLLSSRGFPVTVATGSKARYDSDDMKIRRQGRRLLEIGKGLSSAAANGESVGALLFRGDGPRLFRDALEQTMRRDDASSLWYPSAVGALARIGVVGTVSIDGIGWAEIDSPADLEAATRLMAGWAHAPAPADLAVNAG